jgi:ADP-heptose:LPS heptosyltransferase
VALGFGGGSNVKTRTALKTWPISSYVRLAEELEQLGYDVVWVGDKADARSLPSGHPGRSLAGRLSVAETAAVLAACDLVVSNDSLAMHLADSLGVPVVGLFGPTDPRQYRPRGPMSGAVSIGHTLSCSPCHRNEGFPPCAFEHRCMRDLTVEMVVSEIQSLPASRVERIGGRSTA